MSLPEYRLRNQREAALWYCLAGHRKVHARKERSQSDMEKNSLMEKKRLDWVALFTLMLVIVVFLQLYTYTATERAVVTIADIQFKGKNNPTVGQPLTAVIDVKNSGRSTAFITRARFYSRLVFKQPFPSRPEYPEFAKVTNSAVNGPLVAQEIDQVFFRLDNAHRTTGGPFDAPSITEIEQGRMKIYVFGYIRYLDAYSVFGWPEHQTGFCSHYDPSAGMFLTCDEDAYAYGN